MAFFFGSLGDWEIRGGGGCHGGLVFGELGRLGGWVGVPWRTHSEGFRGGNVGLNSGGVDMFEGVERANAPTE